MNQTVNIVTEALEYYDKNKEASNKLFSKIKYYKLVNTSIDTEHSKILFYDGDQKKIFESRYEVIGIFNSEVQMWVWAWSIPKFNKNDIYTVKKILNYGIDIPPTADIKFLKSELITSRFRVTDPIQLEIHASIASYISKIPLIYNLSVVPEVHEKYFNPKLRDPNPDVKTLLEVVNPKFTDLIDYQDYYLFLLDFETIIPN
jgi:hypothetical protein